MTRDLYNCRHDVETESIEIDQRRAHDEGRCRRWCPSAWPIKMNCTSEIGSYCMDLSLYLKAQSVSTRKMMTDEARRKQLREWKARLLRRRRTRHTGRSTCCGECYYRQQMEKTINGIKKWLD